jgi:hypothetical protein
MITSTIIATLKPNIIHKGTTDANGKFPSKIRSFLTYAFSMYFSKENITKNIAVRTRSVTESPKRPICGDRKAARLIVIVKITTFSPNHKASNETYLSFLETTGLLNNAQYLDRLEARKIIIPKYFMYSALATARSGFILKTLCRNEAMSVMGRVTNNTRKGIITVRNT